MLNERSPESKTSPCPGSNCPQAESRTGRLVQDGFLDEVLAELYAGYADRCGVNTEERVRLPSENEVNTLIGELSDVLFPGYSGTRLFSERTLRYSLGDMLSRIYEQLFKLINRALLHQCTYHEKNPCKTCDIQAKAEIVARAFLARLPQLRSILKKDIAAAFEGDPAAANHDEVLVSYPGLRAVAIQRMAHELYALNVPLIPRMMTEQAHSRTGIDIHPGAKLGEGIFIDHGTGVVIGETAVLGDGVKLYQGVTLGALSFPKTGEGTLIRGAKRHPTIERNVTLYAGSTILGDVVIGENSVIGGNVWLTESLPPNSKVTLAHPELDVRVRKKKA